MTGRLNNTLKKHKYRLKAIAIMTAICVLAVSFASGCSSSVSPKDIQYALTYIRSLEERDVKSIEENMFSHKKEAIIEEAESKIEIDPDYVWTALADIGFVILGDSRAVAFGAYGLMDERYVLAEGGLRCIEVETHFDELRVLNPRLVVLSYGMNDIHWGFYEPEEYAEYLCGVVDQIQDMLPEAYIYIQAILPPNEVGIQQAASYGLCREWNVATKAYVEGHGYRYLDIEWLVDEYGDEYFGEDGVHFYAGFYKYWAMEILKQYLTDSMEDEA